MSDALSRIRARDEARREERERRHQERDEANGPPPAQSFGAAFEAERAAASAALSQRRVDEARASLARLRSLLAEAALSLCPYDIRQSQERIDALQRETDAAVAAAAPRKGFSFRSRSAVSPSSSPASSSAAASPSASPCPPAAPVAPAAPALPPATLSGLRGQTVVLADTGEGRKDVSLEGLEDCVVYVRRPCAALRAAGLARCAVHCAAVAGSVLLDRCVACEVSAAARQVRVHECASCTLWLCPTSGPIIEQCSALVFGPYAVEYEGRDEDLAALGLPRAGEGAWRDVEDFSWLKQGLRSPNWSLAPSPRAAPVRLPSAPGDLPAAPQPPAHCD
eukprot:m51a1_g10784 hypothetical protein (337) ;mRNA; f:56966-58127